MGSPGWAQAGARRSEPLAPPAEVRVSIFSASPENPDGSTFDCLVFASSSEQECEEIVRSIGMGTASARGQHHRARAEY